MTPNNSRGYIGIDFWRKQVSTYEGYKIYPFKKDSECGKVVERENCSRNRTRKFLCLEESAWPGKILKINLKEAQIGFGAGLCHAENKGFEIGKSRFQTSFPWEAFVV